jgi:hypothetical protein
VALLSASAKRTGCRREAALSSSSKVHCARQFMKTTLILIILTVLVVGCSKPPKGETVVDNPRGLSKEQAVCEVHNAKMELKEVDISYGEPRDNEWTGDTEHRLFPHWREYSIGGCEISENSPKTVKAYVCADCKKACEKWKAENKK